MKRLILSFICLFFLTEAGFSVCYLVVEDQNIVSEQVANQIAILELSRYIEEISEIPPVGLSEGVCQYRLTITDAGEGFLMVIKGPRLSSYAEFGSAGLQGFQQALFRTIIKEYPEHTGDICKRNRTIMERECEFVNGKTPPPQSDSIVIDKSTYLTWQKLEPGKMNWKQAASYCDNLTLAGFNNWRLPDDNEIRSTQKINHLFPNLKQDYYWSATRDESDEDYALGYSVTNNSIFSDWIKNRYYVRCVRGGKLVNNVVTPTLPEDASMEEEIVAEEKTSEEDEKDPVGLRWVVGPTYISGYADVIAIYIHNLEELGYSKGEESAGYPMPATFSPYWQMESGLRFGAGIGPIMSLIISAGEEDYSFAALPININAGYTLSNGLFVRGGMSMLNASGEFVASESVGLFGAVGIEVNRKKALSLGVEIGLDTATVDIEKYDCSDVYNPTALSSCDKETKTVQPIGFMTSFLFAF